MDSVVFLGTVSATPTKHCNVSAYVIKLSSGRQWLVDCGEGTQHQFLRTDLVKAGRIDVILITHLHGDHCFGLPGFLASLSLTGTVSKITLVGPVGLKKMIDVNIELSATYLTYVLEVVELEPQEISKPMVFQDMTVVAYPLRHKVACFGFIITEPQKPGALDGKKAAALGAKGKDLGLLKAGKDVTLPNGTVVKATDVLSEPKPGKRVLAMGDTSNSDSMLEAGQNCDCVIHETTYDCDREEKAIEGGHSTTTMAGLFAKNLNAKKLIITHFSKRYIETSESDPTGKTIKHLLDETQRVCPETQVFAATEFASFDI